MKTVKEVDAEIKKCVKTTEEIDVEIAKCKEERKVIQDQINKLYEATIPLSDKINELKELKLKLQGNKLNKFLMDQTAITYEWLERIGGVPDCNLETWDFAGVIEMTCWGNHWEAVIPGNDNFVATLNTRHDVVSLLLAMKLQDKLKTKGEA